MLLGKLFINFGRPFWEAVQKQKVLTVTTPPDDERLIRELSEIIEECSVENWNGHGAKAIDRNSIDGACEFLGLLPSGVSYPEFCPEPNGDLGMVWEKRGYHVSISIDADGTIAWGGTSPQGRIYGDSKIEDGLPKEVLNLLYEIEGAR